MSIFCIYEKSEYKLPNCDSIFWVFSSFFFSTMLEIHGCQLLTCGFDSYTGTFPDDFFLLGYLLCWSPFVLSIFNCNILGWKTIHIQDIFFFFSEIWFLTLFFSHSSYLKGQRCRSYSHHLTPHMDSLQLSYTSFSKYKFVSFLSVSQCDVTNWNSDTWLVKSEVVGTLCPCTSLPSSTPSAVQRLSFKCHA